ncbi:MAG TPA: M14 family zinc carboxypeptidase [Anaerolineales bacterium]|nr:M14 family zinc carboxypeptidase [Anaerolineales bacterium]
MPRRGTLSALVWILNGSAAVLLLAILIVYFTREPAQASGSPFVYLGGTPRPTSTAAPTSFYLPTVTPNPLATPIEDFSTPTPFVFTGGPAGRIIGYSVEGTPIEYFAFGQGERQYLIVAGIHGGYEGNTTDLANKMVVHLADHPEVVPSDATLFIINNMNPDGAARGRNADGRTNAHGVDLNRNFPSHNWVADWDHSNCWNTRPTTGGSAAGSEPETRSVMNFIASHRIRALISYHSAALGVFPGGDPWEPASERLASALAAATGYPYPPIDIGCTYTGTLADWAVENGVGAAVDMELSDHKDAEFNRNLPALKALLEFQG